MLIAELSPDGRIISAVAGDRKVVLENQRDTPLELRTISTGPRVTAPGTYLAPDDFAKFTSPSAKITVRAYTWRDTVRKVKSRAGIYTLWPTAMAIVGALGSLGFLLFVVASPAATISTETAEALVAWVQQPTEQSAANPPPNLEVQQRTELAAQCLASLRGEPVPRVEIPGIQCAANPTPVWRTPLAAGTFAALLAGVGGAIAGLLLLEKSFGFQKSPE
ncbi:hypothetical protein [Rhodococcus ruber]|uniref:hypothetical protein n=1 Tax=Rhodococcus ruber TaxID=1830 RepID=UPI000F536037|nr:hypothetical protein [Rhodococcus ruber]